MKFSRIMFIWLLLVPLMAASKMPLSYKMQAALFRKILSYDTKLKDNPGKLVILLLDTTNDPDTQKMKSALASVGFKVLIATGSEIEKHIEQADIVYVMPGVAPGVYKKTCEQYGRLSISGVTNLAEKGHVSIEVGLKDDRRPRIIVNIKQVQAEKHELTSDLFTLVEVIR